MICIQTARIKRNTYRTFGVFLITKKSVFSKQLSNRDKYGSLQHRGLAIAQRESIKIAALEEYRENIMGRKNTLDWSQSKVFSNTRYLDKQPLYGGSPLVLSKVNLNGSSIISTSMGDQMPALLKYSTYFHIKPNCYIIDMTKVTTSDY